MRCLFVVACLVAGVCSADPRTIYVDDDAYGMGGNGTEQSPYGTLQDAVSNADEGDTVLVLPGTYDRGFATYAWTSDGGTGHVFTNRVSITKRIYLKSRDGAAATTILGAWDESVPVRNHGVGPAAVRCVYVAPTAARTVIEGFTFRNGAAHVYQKDDGKTVIADITANRGGGVLADGATRASVYVTDSVFDHCTGTRGGALRYGTAVRCRFVHGETPAGSSICRGSMLVHCLADDNSGLGAAMMEVAAYNCTFSNNGGSGAATFGSKVRLYNCIVAGNHAQTFSAQEVTGTVLGGSVLSGLNQANFFETDLGTSVIDPDALPLLAPLFGDFRPRRGSAAETVAEASYLELAEAEIVEAPVVPVDVWRSLDDEVLPKTGRIVAGCCQKTVAAAGGAFLCERAVRAKGYSGRADVALWAFSETPQDVFQVRAAVDGRLFRWFYRNGDAYRDFDLEMDDSVWCVMPPVGVVVTNTYSLPAETRYVGGRDASDATGDGSQLKPFATIQKALERSTGSGNLSRLILVAEGTYDSDEGVIEDGTRNAARVTVGAAHVRILGAGAGKSIVKGRPDPDTGGRGPKALRCFNLQAGNYTALIQGFTLCDGYANNGTENIDKNRGGLVFGQTESYHRILDCELTRGDAFRSSVAHSVCIVRCRIHDCKADGGALVRPGTLKNSLVYDCPRAVSGAYLFEATLVNCTVFGSDSPIFSSDSATSYPHDCVFCCNNTAIKMPTAAVGNVIYQSSSATCSADNYRGDPLFADPDEVSRGLMAASPALSRSVLLPDYWLHTQSDIYGNPMIYRNGKPLAGGVQRCVQSVTVSPSAVAADCTVTPAGSTALAPGASVTVTATAAAGSPRRVKGFEVNGELQEGVTSWTYTAPADGSWTAGGMVVTPVMSADWYVSPTGSDTADGLTPETAFRTFTNAMAVARSGETVHALEGIHADGQFEATAKSGVPNRLVIKDGVNVIGDAGAEKTVIMGGLGVRPAYFNSTSGSLRGVTLTGAVLETSGDGTDRSGGGVYSADDIRTVTVVDCIISNNVCARGGGARGCTLVNCRIVGNDGHTTSGAALNTTLIGCYMADNYCGSGQLLRYPRGLYNCTIAADNRNVANVIVDNSFPIVNCAILCGNYNSGTVGGVTNCTVLASQEVRFVGKDNRTVASAADAKVDASGRPAADSPLVNVGANELVPSDLENDLAGVPRVLHANVDIGAYEYDWRPAFAAKLGKGVTVTEVSSDVTLDETGVVVPDGSSLSARIDGGLANRLNRYGYGFALADGARLHVDFCNGEGTALHTTSGENTIRSRTIPADFTFGALGGAAILSKLESTCGGLILVFK